MENQDLSCFYNNLWEEVNGEMAKTTNDKNDEKCQGCGFVPLQHMHLLA